jgi:hypothetical protein
MNINLKSTKYWGTKLTKKKEFNWNKNNWKTEFIKKKETIGIVIKLDPIGQFWNILT